MGQIPIPVQRFHRRTHRGVASALSALALLAASPASGDLAAYGAGQSEVRLFQDSVMPGICGIALERARCDADSRAMQAWHAGAPGFSWWQAAGAVSIAIEQPKNDTTSEYLAHYVDLLASHPADAPPGFANLVSANGSSFERALPLQRALDGAIPVVPYPAPAFAAGLTGTARLGAYHATLLELVDNPLGLSRPESRAFAAAVLAELQRLHHAFSDGLSLARLQAAVNADIPDDPQQLDAQWRRPLTEQVISVKWPLASRKAFLIGGCVTQIAYNAAVLKDPNADSEFRKALSELSLWSAATPAVRADIAALQKIAPAATGGSWDDIAKAAARATLDLTGAP